MPLYKQSEFADLIGKSSAHVSMCVKRGQLLRNEKKEIDTGNAVNREWLSAFVKESNFTWTNDGRLQDKQGNIVTNKKRSSNKEVKSVEEVQLHKKLPKPEDVTGEENLDEFDTTGMDADETSLMKMDITDVRRIEVVQKILKLREDTALAKIKVEKAEGELIPTDLVRFTILRNNKELTAAYENSLNEMIADLGQRHRLSGEVMSNYKKMIIDVINKANKDAAEATKREINNIVAEFSEKRGKGEKQ